MNTMQSVINTSYKLEDAMLKRVFGVAQILAKSQQSCGDNQVNAKKSAENRGFGEMLYCEDENLHLQHE